MSTEVIGLIALAALVLLIFLRVPVAVSMGLVGFTGYAAIGGWTSALTVLGQVPFDLASGYALSVVPLFILMGDLATNSGMSNRLYHAARSLCAGVRGSQALATVGACAAFGAVCGSSLATAATMTRVSMPEMKRLGYDDRLSTGSVAAGGSLGILIPPSIPLVIYAIIAEQSVTRLFAAGLVPGVVLTALYMLSVVVLVKFKPAWAPADARMRWAERFSALYRTLDLMVLFGVTIGGMYLGWFTPTEAAAVGAFGAFVLGFAGGHLSLASALKGLATSVRTTCMLFMILICAVVFSYFVVLAQLPAALVGWMQQLNFSPLGLMVSIILFYIVLGCFMEGFGMILITVPVFLPVAVQAGFDPVWFGIMLVIVIELGLIHPPVGMNIFVIQAQAPEIPVMRVYQGILPFLLAPFALLAIMLAYPQMALWLPHLLFPQR